MIKPQALSGIWQVYFDISITTFECKEFCSDVKFYKAFAQMMFNQLLRFYWENVCESIFFNKFRDDTIYAI